MTERTYSAYDVRWCCNTCGLSWEVGAEWDGPCTATENCSGQPVGMAFYSRPATADEAVRAQARENATVRERSTEGGRSTRVIPVIPVDGPQATQA